MAKRTKKRDRAGGGDEELIAGVPLRRVQEFLCRHEHSDWFDFDWFNARRLVRDLDEAESSRTRQRLTREMLARGWIEKVASRAAKQRCAFEDRRNRASRPANSESRGRQARYAAVDALQSNVSGFGWPFNSFVCPLAPSQLPAGQQVGSVS